MTEYETQLDDVLAVLKGDQNFAIVEKRKAPQTYTWLLRAWDDYDRIGDSAFPGYHLDTHVSAEGEEVILARPGFFQAYCDLLEDRDKFPTRRAFQTAVGSLLGYDPESIEEFTSNPPDCECSKCGGPYKVNPSDRITIEGGDWDPTENKRLFHGEKPYGVFQAVDYDAIARNPAIQPWSRGKRVGAEEDQKRRGL